MKTKFAKLALLAVAATTLLSGCMVVDPHRDHDGYRDGYRDGPRGDRDRDRDRDRDGVPNRYDARPDDPYRR
jgi:hypothetical protein